MLELHALLAERYRNLSSERSGPVYFIEHGFGEDERCALRSSVRDAIRRHSIGDDWWAQRRLPLLVTAVETGYRYLGTGTDFWPKLEEELDHPITLDERRHLRDHFEQASDELRGARPPLTRWARAFHLIAWPITHSLLPVELHRPLAMTLSHLRVHIPSAKDEHIYEAVRIAAINRSARFSTLLEDPSLIIALVKSLLGQDSKDLCQATMLRIARDLRADKIARRNVAAAIRKQRSTTPNAAQPISAPPATIRGTLRLNRRAEGLTLEALFPTPGADQAKLRRALRRRRYAPRLWGATAPILSDQLLSGNPFTLKLTSAPKATDELLPDLTSLEIDDALRRLLGGYMLDIEPPLLFAIAADGASARQVRGPSISGYRKYWLLTPTAEALSSLSPLCEVGPYTCYEVDPYDEASRETLTSFGFQVRFGTSLLIAGAPPLRPQASPPKYAAGDRWLAVPRNLPPDGVIVSLGDAQASLTSEEVAQVFIEPGEHIVYVSGDEERSFPLTGAPSLPPPPPACSIELRSEELTVQALLRGMLTFAVDSYAPLEGLELTFELSVAGVSRHITAPLPPLPSLITLNDGLLSQLIGDDAARTWLAQSDSATLRLNVGQLAERSIQLEHRVRPCWWQQTGDHFSLFSEVAQLPIAEVPLDNPAATPEPSSGELASQTRLLVPQDLDVSLYGDAALFTGLCAAPRRAPLQAPALRRPRLQRRRRASKGAVGLEDLAEAYLRWALAESTSTLAEMRRQHITRELDLWCTDLCCGHDWARDEARTKSFSPWELLFEEFDKAGFGRDPWVEAARADELQLTHLAVREIRRDYPELWTRVGALDDLTDDDYEALDLACGRAYSYLAESYEAQGQGELAELLSQGDPGAAPEQWRELLSLVKRKADMEPLAELLLPSNLATSLIQLDPTMMSLSELTEELGDWARSAEAAFAGGRPSADTLAAALALWLEPERAIRLDWRSALDTLLAERAVARAVRYLALRARQTSRGGALI